MPQITIRLEGVDRVTQFFNNGIEIKVHINNNMIVVNLEGSVTMYVEGGGISCFSTVEDDYGSIIKPKKEYQYNDNGVAMIRYYNF
ncbi:MAG: hypothetical protein IPP04_06850 [Saprospiraceae bacterium]|nr:hypothetical protein [Saprospiraceae bacterium]